MTPVEIEETYARAFGQIRQNSDPSVWGLVDAMQRSMELTLGMLEAQRLKATLLDGMLETRLAVTGGRRSTDV